jgi:hypothetical protein
MAARKFAMPFQIQPVKQQLGVIARLDRAIQYPRDGCA